MRTILPALAGAAVLALAAAAPGQPPSGRGGSVNPGNGVKEQIGATDEEWKVIGPKLQKVVAARQVLASDAAGPEGGSGGPFPGPGGRPGSSFAGPGEPPGGPGFFPGGPGPAVQPGQVLPPFLRDGLNLTPEQKKQLDALQKDVDDRLKTILTADQQKQLSARKDGPGPGGPPPGGPLGGPAGGNLLRQSRADLKAVLDDPHHTAAEVREKVVAVRAAREKALAALDAAQKDLLPLLTAEQEAALVSLGIMD